MSTDQNEPDAAPVPPSAAPKATPTPQASTSATADTSGSTVTLVLTGRPATLTAFAADGVTVTRAGTAVDAALAPTLITEAAACGVTLKEEGN